MTLYSIKDLEYLSGIKAHTIRIWEKRYNLLEPDRTETNIRSYSDYDVRRILNIAMLVKSGYKISNVASFDEEKLQSEIIRITKNSNDAEKSIDQLLIQTVNLNVFGFEELLDKIIAENGLSAHDRPKRRNHAGRKKSEIVSAICGALRVDVIGLR